MEIKILKYINVDELKKEFPKNSDWEYPVNTNEYVCEIIDSQPIADVRENVHGKWEKVVSGCAILTRCNQCKNAISENDFFEICRKVNHGSKLLDFCPNCGADMRERGTDE